MERTTEENPRQKKISTIFAETFPTTVGSWRQTERERLYAELDDDAKTKPVVFYGLGSGQAIRQSTHPDSSNGPASSTPICSSTVSYDRSDPCPTTHCQNRGQPPGLSRWPRPSGRSVWVALSCLLSDEQLLPLWISDEGNCGLVGPPLCHYESMDTKGGKRGCMFTRPDPMSRFPSTG